MESTSHLPRNSSCTLDPLPPFLVGGNGTSDSHYWATGRALDIRTSAQCTTRNLRLLLGEEVTPWFMEGLDYDVVVVGAGLAGLRITQLLVQQGLSVLCLEANTVHCAAQIWSLYYDK